MKLLSKTWFRIVISLLIASLFLEITRMSGSNPNRPMSANENLFLMIGAVVIYFLLSSISKKEKGTRL